MPLNHVKLSQLKPLLAHPGSLVCILAGLLTLMAACTSTGKRPMQWRSAEGVVWATTYHITYRASADLTDSIIATLRRVELSLSPFDPASRISAINEGTDSLTDSLIRRAYHRSLEVSAASDGMFDPTVGPLVELWGFGKNRIASPAPAPADIAQALSRVGIARCSIDSLGFIHKPHPATTFNFSAITKGLGVDEVAATLRRAGASDYLVEIGGEMALSGHSPRGTLWRVSIDAPRPDSTAAHHALLTIEATDCGIATSGNYRNYHSSPSGERLGHTISPRTGRPVSTDLLSATVIAPDCMTADALATACMALGADSAISLILSRPDTEALLVSLGDPYTVRTTPGFPRQNYPK